MVPLVRHVSSAATQAVAVARVSGRYQQVPETIWNQTAVRQGSRARQVLFKELAVGNAPADAFRGAGQGIKGKVGEGAPGIGAAA